LADLTIIPVADAVYRPRELALLSQPDLWGRWKRSWSPTDLTPDRAELLAKAGVARVLTESLSAEFFQWLGAQSTSVQRAHLPQIHRHLRDRRGPLKWWSAEPTLRCLPTLGSGDMFELVSYNWATHGRSVFLPDFQEVRDVLLQRDRSIRLVITDVEGLSGTLFSQLRKVGVKSLRASFGRPVELTAGGDIAVADEKL